MLNGSACLPPKEEIVRHIFVKGYSVPGKAFPLGEHDSMDRFLYGSSGTLLAAPAGQLAPGTTVAAAPL